MKKFLLLILIFLIGFLLRLFPIRTGMHYWDETVYLQHAEIMAGIRKNNYNEFDFRPPLLSLLISLSYLLNYSLITAHLLVSFLSSLGIPLTYFLSSIFFKNDKVAWLAALIFAFNPLHILSSHFILTDAALPTFWISTILLFHLSLRKKKYKFYIATGILLALSILLKFTSFILIFLILLTLYLEKIRDVNFVEELSSKKMLVLFISFLITLSPYLVFSKLKFNNFFYTFVKGWKMPSSDVPTSKYFFFENFASLFPLPFLLGILVFLFSKVFLKKVDSYEVLLILYILLPLFFLQEMVHKEMRFLLILLPFLSILSAKGFSFLLEFKKFQALSSIFILSMFILSFREIYSIPEIKKLFNLTFLDYYEEEIMKASLWLNENSEENAIVYTNFQFPVVAYYSKRKIVLLPMLRSFQNEINYYLPDPGYLIVSSNSPIKEPSIDFLMNDRRFKLIKKFSSEEETVYIFKYR